MKTILEVKFNGECKAPVFTTRRGKHLFCGEPTPEGASYCAPCGRRMVLPTRHYADTAAMADAFGGGLARGPTRDASGPNGSLKTVDGYINEAIHHTRGSNIDAVGRDAYFAKIRIAV